MLCQTRLANIGTDSISLAPLVFLGSFLRKLEMTMVDAEKLLELLQRKPSVNDNLDAPDLKLIDGEVSFRNVSFSYDNRKPTIRNITFTAGPGSTIALVGETGSGKTTLLKLLFRFFDIDKGSISIDGQNIKDVTLNSLRDNIGVVPQVLKYI